MADRDEVKSDSMKQILIGGGTFVILFALLAAGYFYWQNQKTQNLLKNPTLAAQVQTTELISAVGKLIALPQNETPTIATVSDVTKLKDQPFFQNAKNGDKVLIYTKAKEAILYRPSENKIITVAPVNIGSSPTVTISPTGGVKGASTEVSISPSKKPTPTSKL